MYMYSYICVHVNNVHPYMYMYMYNVMLLLGKENSAPNKGKGPGRNQGKKTPAQKKRRTSDSAYHPTWRSEAPQSCTSYGQHSTNTKVLFRSGFTSHAFTRCNHTCHPVSSGPSFKITTHVWKPCPFLLLLFSFSFPLSHVSFLLC